MGQSKSKHILLVEDYDPVRELIANMLEDRSYRVSTVPAGASMRDFLRADDRVDAIVLNTVTPGENGASLARHAKDLGLPVVMISGSNDEISFAAEHGFSSFANRLRRRSSTARSTGRSLAASSASGAHDGSVEGRQNRKFIQALTLLEFLADPRDYRKFEDVKKIVARYVATTREEYARILEQFLELTGK